MYHDSNINETVAGEATGALVTLNANFQSESILRVVTIAQIY
jgi:hypothetical protein